MTYIFPPHSPKVTGFQEAHAPPENRALIKQTGASVGIMKNHSTIVKATQQAFKGTYLMMVNRSLKNQSCFFLRTKMPISKNEWERNSLFTLKYTQRMAPGKDLQNLYRVDRQRILTIP